MNSRYDYRTIELAASTAYVPVARFDLARIALGENGLFGEADGDMVVIGRTIEVSAEYERRLTVDRSTGVVRIDSFDEHASTAVVNSSIDRLVTSIHVYESWHDRIINAPYNGQLIEARLIEAAEQLRAVDPGLSDRSGEEEPWWATKVALIGRLL